MLIYFLTFHLLGSKWDGITLSNLYLLAIVKRPDLRTIRDLNASHLPLLKEMRVHIYRVIFDTYQIPATSLRCFFHYMPTFFRLHLHVSHVDYEAPGIHIGHAHFLEDVINNISEFADDYYQRKTITLILGQGRELTELYLGSSLNCPQS